MRAELKTYYPTDKTQIPRPWFFTFKPDSKYAKNFVVIRAPYVQARDMMITMYNHDWDFQYNRDDFNKLNPYAKLTELTYGMLHKDKV